jgi:HAD superfamily hydrolase (TIGR01509 family)
VVLFDLGGVLLRLRNTGSNFGVGGDERQFHRSWLLSPSVREFERGAISAEQFARNIVTEMQLPYDWQEFLQRFDNWPDRLYPGVTAILDRLAADYRVALLSNTNQVHWERGDVAGLLEPLFHYTFLSFRTGLLKPDRESFEQVSAHFECQLHEILFLDDNPVNVDSANAIGLRAHLTYGIDGIRNVLARTGISPS